MKKVLVLTAGFGEGHNTAARSVREALEATGEAEVQVADLYANAAPLMYSSVKRGYSFAINRAPWFWRLRNGGNSTIPAASCSRCSRKTILPFKWHRN